MVLSSDNCSRPFLLISSTWPLAVISVSPGMGGWHARAFLCLLCVQYTPCRSVILSPAGKVRAFQTGGGSDGWLSLSLWVRENHRCKEWLLHSWPCRLPMSTMRLRCALMPWRVSRKPCLQQSPRHFLNKHTPHCGDEEPKSTAD